MSAQRRLTHPSGQALCEGCGAEIRFALLGTGNRIPIDPTPDPDGNVAVYRDADGDLRGRVVTVARPVLAYERLHHTHFATCPKAERFRHRDQVVHLSNYRAQKAAGKQDGLW